MPWVTGDAAISKRAVANFTLEIFVCVVLICGLCPCRFGIFLLALARIGLIGPQAFCHTTPLQNRTLQVVILMFLSPSRRHLEPKCPASHMVPGPHHNQDSFTCLLTVEL